MFVTLVQLVRSSSEVRVKLGPHQQQCRSNRQQSCQLLRQCCFDIVAGVDRALAYDTSLKSESEGMKTSNGNVQG